MFTVRTCSPAVTELVPELIWAPDFFGPQEIWALRNLGPRKFGPGEIWAPEIWSPHLFGPREIWALRNAGSKKFGRRIKKPCDGSQAGNNFLGTHISWGPKKSGAQMRLGTIPVTAQNSHIRQ